jgi:hypothetical protein
MKAYRGKSGTAGWPASRPGRFNLREETKTHRQEEYVGITDYLKNLEKKKSLLSAWT